MIIKIIPLCLPPGEVPDLTVVRDNDALVVNGERFDFAPLQEGQLLPKKAIESAYIWGDVARRNGRLEITLRVPHTSEASEAARFPEPLIDPPNGVLEFAT
ncbi:hypothetical protein [Achromobacter insolitus]|uniref:hypothetical protein n=1 Tax=Achromobacter insolitus TaxID=217204 RepID=UPI0028ABDF65|nr:hypothetical protein [Achromobacter insolitus]